MGFPRHKANSPPLGYFLILFSQGDCYHIILSIFSLLKTPTLKLEYPFNTLNALVLASKSFTLLSLSLIIYSHLYFSYFDFPPLQNNMKVG